MKQRQSPHGIYGAALLTCTALVAPLVMTAAIGPAAAQTTGAATTETTFTTLGVRASTDIVIRGMDATLRGMDATLRGMAGWRHAFGDVTPLTSVAFSGGGAFTIAGAPVAKDVAIVEAGLDLALTPDAKLGVAYTGQFGSGVVDQSFRANLGVSF